VFLTLSTFCADGTFLTASHAVGVGGGLTGVTRPHSAHNHAHAGAHGHGHNHGETMLYYACRFAVCLLCALTAPLLLCLREEVRSWYCSLCGSLSCISTQLCYSSCPLRWLRLTAARHNCQRCS
jgi:hypothetical protein